MKTDHLNLSTPPPDQAAGLGFSFGLDTGAWKKKWRGIFTKVSQVTNKSRTDTLLEINQEQADALIKFVDPFDNHQDSLAAAVIRLSQVGSPISFTSAICPSYELPHTAKERESETGKYLVGFDHSMVYQAFTNLGQFVRGITQEQVELNVFSLTNLGSGDWTPLVINPLVRNSHGSDHSINAQLNQDTELVRDIGGKVLHSFGIDLNMISMDQVLQHTQAFMEHLGFNQDHLTTLIQASAEFGTELNRFPHRLIEHVAQLIPKNVAPIFYDRGDFRQTIAAGWRSFGYEAALFNFFFYLTLGYYEKNLGSSNGGNRICLPLEIDAYGKEPGTMNTFAAGWNNLHTNGESPFGFGVNRVPVIVPRPLNTIASNGSLVVADSGIRQRWNN